MRLLSARLDEMRNLSAKSISTKRADKSTDLHIIREKFGKTFFLKFEKNFTILQRLYDASKFFLNYALFCRIFIRNCYSLGDVIR